MSSLRFDFVPNTEEKFELTVGDESDVLLSHYEQMREETRMINRESHQRIMRGIGAIAVIFGSVFVQPNAILLFVLLPFIVWFIFMRDMQDAIWVIKIQSKIIDIQRRLDVDEFDWEQEFGFQASDNDQFTSVPNVASGIFLVSIYSFFSWMGVNAVGQVNTGDLLGIVLSPEPLLGIYVLVGTTAVGALAYQSRVITAEKARLKQKWE